MPQASFLHGWAHHLILLLLLLLLQPVSGEGVCHGSCVWGLHVRTCLWSHDRWDSKGIDTNGTGMSNNEILIHPKSQGAKRSIWRENAVKGVAATPPRAELAWRVSRPHSPKVNHNDGTVNYKGGTVNYNGGTVNYNGGTVNYNGGAVNYSGGAVNYNAYQR